MDTDTKDVTAEDIVAEASTEIEPTEAEAPKVPEMTVDSSAKVAALREEADELFTNRQYDEALEKYDEILSLHPYHLQAINRQANIMAIRGRIKRLVEICLSWQTNLEQSDSQDIAGLVAQAILKFDPSSLEARMGVLRHIERTASEEEYIEAVINDANYFVDVGSGELSIKVLQMALDSHPANMELAVKLADMHMAQGNINESIKQFRNIVAFYEFRKDLQKAAELYRRLKVLVPDALDLPMRLGQIYLEIGRCEEAVTEFRAALRVDYTNHDALVGLAKSLAGTGRDEDAVLAFNKILSVDPHDNEVKEQLALLYLKQGANADAVAELSAIASSLVEFKDYDELKRILAKILEIEPANTFAIREMSNANEAIALREARAAKLAELELQAKAQEEAERKAEAEREANKPAAVSEDDLYADDTPLGDLGALDGEDDFDTAPLTEVSAPKEPTVTRVLPGVPQAGSLLVPVPFLVVTYRDIVPLVQKSISAPPNRELVPWNYLPVIDDANVADSDEDNIPAAPVVKQKSGPVASAFGGAVASAFSKGEAVPSAFGSSDSKTAFSSGLFADAVATTSNRHKKRRGHWEFVPAEPPSSVRGADIDANQEALAERLRQHLEQ